MAHSPFFYGWVILVAATIGRIMTSPGQTYSVSIFVEHLIADLGLSRSLVSALYAAGTLLGGLVLPSVGRLNDRHGPRILVAVISAMLAMACLFMRYVDGAAMLAVGFTLIRMMGHASLNMVCTNAANQWWVHRRGAALGLVGLATALLGSGLFPSLVQTLITRFGWRTSWALLGLLVAVVMIPVSLLFLRRRPEEYGLLPDGLGRSVPLPSAAAAIAEDNWTAGEAARTTVFWLVDLSLAVIAMFAAGLQFHIVSIFADVGLSSGAAAISYLPIAVVSALTALASGLVVDRVPVRYVLALALLGLMGALLLAPRLVGASSALAFGAVLGLTNGLQMTVTSVVWAKYYGRHHLGAVTGAASLVTIGGAALGPVLIGMARDHLGSYALVLTAAAALPFALGIAALFAREPRRSAAAS